MKVLVSGSREGFTYHEFVKVFESTYPKGSITEIISGGANGIDRYAKMYSDIHGIQFVEMKANWDAFGKKAGALRNIDMAEYLKSQEYEGHSVSIMAMRYNHSSGTTHMIRVAGDMGIKLYLFDKDSIDFDFD